MDPGVVALCHLLCRMRVVEPSLFRCLLPKQIKVFQHVDELFAQEMTESHNSGWHLHWYRSRFSAIPDDRPGSCLSSCSAGFVLSEELRRICE